jgi:hypothetical protein
MVKEPAIVSVNAFEKFCGGELLSKTRALKFEVPSVEGVPLITPVLDSDNPAGSAPEAMDQL